MANNNKINKILETKRVVVKHLIDNGFLLHDEDGFMTKRDTSDKLMNMPIGIINGIASNYQEVIDKRIETAKSIKPLFNAVMLKTGLGHIQAYTRFEAIT